MAERIHLTRAAPGDVWLVIPGQWRPAVVGGKHTATVSCPECGRSASLSEHDVAPDGEVVPSLVCPRSDCGFHAWATLDGWRPEREAQRG